jgi:hypothetical protein
MAKNFIWLDGSEHDVPDPSWNLEEAQRKGFILKVPPPLVIIPRQSPRKLSPAEEIHKREAMLHEASRSGEN